MKALESPEVVKMLTSPSTSTISWENSVVEEAFGTRSVGVFLLGCRFKERMVVVVVGDKIDGCGTRIEYKNDSSSNGNTTPFSA